MCTCFMFKGKIDQWVHYESIIKFLITFHPVILAATDDGWFDSLFYQGSPNREFLIVLSVFIIQNSSIAEVLKSVDPSLQH